MLHPRFPLISTNSWNRLYGSLLLYFFIVLIGSTAQAQQGLKAEYYDGINFGRLAAVKYVDNIDDYWNWDPPVPGIDPHRCSIRWTGKLKPGKSGTYQFSARVDDGIRVWVNDRLIIDQWELNDVGIFQGTVELVAHREYDLRVEYFNALVEGEVRLLWKIPEAKKSWYESWFGSDDSYVVIAPEYFVQPDEPDKKEELITANLNDNPLSQPTKPTRPETKPVQKEKEPELSPDPLGTDEPESSKKVSNAKEAEQYIPKNIQFEQAKTIILESSYPELNVFVAFMLANSQVKVMIEGHTDPVGDAAMNLKLSKRRAYTIARYLIDKGVDKRRIKAEGYGGSRPLFVPEDGGYYPANRRVVFVLSGLKE